jgi:hypothetical protein
VIDRRHDRQSLKSRLPRALGAKGPTRGFHLSGVQIEAPPQLWSGDPDMVGTFRRSDVRTFRPADVPILELTPLSTIPSRLMHLHGAHFATLLFSSSCMEWGGTPSTFGPPHVSTCFRPIPFLFTFLRTLLHSAKAQPFYFQSFPHSLPKTTRGGGIPFPIALSHFARSTGLAHSQRLPEHQ